MKNDIINCNYLEDHTCYRQCWVYWGQSVLRLLEGQWSDEAHHEEPLKIVGLDNLNNYYDPSLKEYRLSVISSAAEKSPVRHEYRFVKGDLADEALYRGAKFTKAHQPVELVYTEEYEDEHEARMREQQLHGWSRAKKEALIRGDKEALKQLAKGKADLP